MMMIKKPTLPCRVPILAALLILACASFARAENRDLEELLNGVREIAKPGVPGPFAVFGQDAFAVATGTTGSGTLHAVVAAARYGRGRAVAFGHTGYFGALNTGQTGQLLFNALRWTAKGKKKPRIGLMKAGLPLAFLKEHGLEAAPVPAQDKEKPRAIHGFDVVLAGTHGLGSDDIDDLDSFVRKGGGMIVAGLGWGWQQLNPEKELVLDHPGNRLLAPMGMVYADGYLNRIDVVNDPVDENVLELCHAGQLLEKLDEIEALPDKDRSQVCAVLIHAIRAIPPDDRIFLPDVEQMLNSCTKKAPTSDAPLAANDMLSRIALILEHERSKDLPPDRIDPALSAAVFPGEAGPGARRVLDSVDVDLAIHGWTGTGLYALAGCAITVETPEEILDKGLWVRIGCHSDTLWNKSSWSRHPDVCVRAPLDKNKIKIASPHGGLVYIEVPNTLWRGVYKIKLRRCIRAPNFVLDETSTSDWQKKLRDLPAPWAELETSKIILTVPSEHIRSLDDPESTLRLWDRVLDCYAELGARPLPARPERMVCDVQISAGYMHSGYPIMMHLDAAPVVVNEDTLLNMKHGGVWGLFHELGHNHQQAGWTFDGAVEVTCNLFTLYVLDKILGITPIESEQMRGVLPRVKKRLAGEGDTSFAAWKRDPFLALYMYVQLQHEFGWELFTKTFAEYLDLPPGKRPKNDDEKRDQWLVRLSKTAGRNLGPFFEAWGVPTSDEARASIEELEEWMPEMIKQKHTGGN